MSTNRGRELSYYAKLVASGEAARKGLVAPFLVWTTGGTDPSTTERVLFTQTGPGAGGLTGEGRAYEVRRASGQSNGGFLQGITVGRSDVNDIAVVDHSISRFHAYFRQEAGVWHLVDAGSKNGTWVGSVKLKHQEDRALTDGQMMTFGHVKMLFLLPQAFVTFVSYMKKGSGP